MTAFYNLNLVGMWVQIMTLVMSLAALIISIIVYRQVAKFNTLVNAKRQILSRNKTAKPILERYKSIDVSLMITAKRNSRNELRLTLKNNGIVTAKDIEVVIADPVRITSKKELANGANQDSTEINSALRPRLTMIDSDSIFPMTELLPDVEFDIFAITTMGYGKICDFPVSLSWMDDRGSRHYQDEIMTI